MPRLVAFLGWQAVVLSLSGGAWAAEVCVDARNTTAPHDGTAAHPHPTIQAGVDAAAPGDTVKVAVGHYQENVMVSGKAVALRGGYRGATTYVDGAVGDFDNREDGPASTWVEGSAGEATVTFFNASHSRLERFRVTGGRHGVLVAEDAWPPALSDVTLSGNTVEDNGTADLDLSGGGVNISGDDMVVAGNVVRGNHAGLGGGIFAHHGQRFLIQGNVVEDNVGHSDHGGGLSINGSGTVSHNVIRGNRIGQTVGYGWGGGIIVVEAHDEPVHLQHNVVTGNFAPSAGGGVFIDEGATAHLSHELIHGNTGQNSGGGLYVDGSWDDRPSTAYLDHCTLADNLSPGWPGVGGGVYVEASHVWVQNSIVWGNQAAEGHADVALAAGGTVSVTYSLLQASWPGEGNLSQDPLFAGGGDHHLRSRAGRWLPGDGGGTWVVDNEDSPALDRADPAAPYHQEPLPHGDRANLGCHGNTPEASKSPQGTGPDAGRADAGRADAGTPPGGDGSVPGGDAGGPGPDGSLPDAGAGATDASVRDGTGGNGGNGESPAPGTCQCQPAPVAGEPAGAWLIVVIMVALRRGASVRRAR
jgi:hypothetical protein